MPRLPGLCGPFQISEKKYHNKIDGSAGLLEGWSIQQRWWLPHQLLYDKDKLCKVDEGRAQALRRLLATERMLARPQFKDARKNFNKKLQDCNDKGYLVELKDFKGDLEGVMNAPTCFQPYSFAIKDQEKLSPGNMGSSPGDEQPVVSPDSQSFPEPPNLPCQDGRPVPGTRVSVLFICPTS